MSVKELVMKKAELGNHHFQQFLDDPQPSGFRRGHLAEHARLIPIIEALAEAVERSNDLSQAMPPNAVSMELHRSIKSLKQKLEEL